MVDNIVMWQVVDVKSERVLSTCSVLLTTCLEAPDMTLDVQPYILRGSQTDSELYMRISIKVGADTSPQLTVACLDK